MKKFVLLFSPEYLRSIESYPHKQILYVYKYNKYKDGKIEMVKTLLKISADQELHTRRYKEPNSIDVSIISPEDGIEEYKRRMIIPTKEGKVVGGKLWLSEDNINLALDLFKKDYELKLRDAQKKVDRLTNEVNKIEVLQRNFAKGK